jgi:hypothetical protein
MVSVPPVFAFVGSLFTYTILTSPVLSEQGIVCSAPAGMASYSPVHYQEEEGIKG